MAYRTRDRRSAAASAAAVAALLTASTAVAQPNPFDDYDEGASAVPLDEPAPELPPEEPAPAVEELPPAEAAPHSYTDEQYQWSIGLLSQFSYSGSTNEVLGGGDESNRTLYLRLAPRVGFFPIDHFEVGLAMGLLTQLAARESGDSVAQNNFFFEASGHYHVPVAAGFAIVPGLGLGGYFGSSSRTLGLPDGTEFDESTGAQGFLINGHLGVGYQPSANWRLRSGVTIGGLVGSETVSSQDATLASSAMHVGIPIELSYLFH